MADMLQNIMAKKVSQQKSRQSKGLGPLDVKTAGTTDSFNRQSALKLGEGALNMTLRNILASVLPTGAGSPVDDPQVFPIHPSNFFIFPQLDGFWQHYARWRMGKILVAATPTAPETQGGNMILTTTDPSI